ncbi:hypothetical protein PAHAL_1G382600 [Panicum hallii]|uniref:Uncharacterized protein n=1 Tax=Panicum hallii TaxID=206008 RepID=A0A2T8KXK8_9POAL|nr:hypothetical protein PAHAL_1G382600 [Panicum hallii]
MGGMANGDLRGRVAGSGPHLLASRTPSHPPPPRTSPAVDCIHLLRPRRLPAAAPASQAAATGAAPVHLAGRRPRGVPLLRPRRLPAAALASRAAADGAWRRPPAPRTSPVVVLACVHLLRPCRRRARVAGRHRRRPAPPLPPRTSPAVVQHPATHATLIG